MGLSEQELAIRDSAGAALTFFFLDVAINLERAPEPEPIVSEVEAAAAITSSR